MTPLAERVLRLREAAVVGLAQAARDAWRTFGERAGGSHEAEARPFEHPP